jgi:hypothetical protein
MSMKYIRQYYGVPAKRGARIEYSGDETSKFIQGFLFQPKKGTIVGAQDQYLRVRFDGSTRIETVHATWKVKYL